MMMLSEAATMLRAPAPKLDAQVLRVASDTRALKVGDLFVAIAGENFDGHQFAPEALTRGAAGVLVSRDMGLDSQIVVPDSKLGLGALALAWRARFSLPLIAVTGSNGKTTVTQMLASILRAHAGEDAFYTEGNFNNDIGLPLTLLRLRAHHRVGAVEIGMNHRGEIAQLAAIARPTVALINNAQREHQEFMKSVAEVAEENGSVLEFLPADGVAVLNADDEFFPRWRELAGARRIVSFGLNAEADVSAEVEAALFGSHLKLRVGNHTAEVVLKAAGQHNARNACAAAACAWAAGVPVAAIVAGLNNFMPYQGRMQKKVARSGAVVIDDSYNANPDSVRAAIDVLAQVPAPRVLVLGRMGEVGDQGPAFHAEVGAYAKQRGVSELICFGPDTAPAVEAFGHDAVRFDEIEAVAARALGSSAAGTTLLVKGSRSARMERVVAALTGEAGGAH